MNFIKIVEEMLLTEDPDSAFFCYHDSMGSCDPWKDFWKPDVDYEDLYFEASDAGTFQIVEINFNGPRSHKETALIYSKPGFENENVDHLYQRAMIEAERIDDNAQKLNPTLKKWNSIPVEIKQKLLVSAQNWNKTDSNSDSPPYTLNLDTIIPGRYWLTKDRFFVSMWRGDEAIIKKWLEIALPVWNPNNLPFFYQAPGEKPDHWVDGNKFLKSASDSVIKSPEIDKIEKEINKLLPQVHVKSGSEKQAIKNQIRALQNKIKSLGGVLKSQEDSFTSKGSYKQGQLAGKMSVAQMKSLAQTSESIVC